jgi:NAD(P)-dependent dehydrogenase (short-subunit alcohol dehydrogenase family)
VLEFTQQKKHPSDKVVGGMVAGAVAAGVAGYLTYRHCKRDPSSFRDKVVVITGGSRGLGLELARGFAKRGASIAICARTLADLRLAAAELRGSGARVLAVVCDITKQAQCDGFVKKVIEKLGAIDVLVNNAGVIQAGPLGCMTLDDFATSMATHFWGPLYLIDRALPHMRSQLSGQIVNIASIGGEIGVPHLAPYCAGKFALVGLSEGLSTELRGEGIYVTTVCPGLMRTGSPRNAMFKGRYEAEYAWFSISDSLPVFSISSRSAAETIIESVRRRDRFLRLSLPAKVAAPLRAMFPGLTRRFLELANRLLPKPDGTGGATSKRGYESVSSWSPSILTRLTDEAARGNNELGNSGTT